MADIIAGIFDLNGGVAAGLCLQFGKFRLQRGNLFGWVDDRAGGKLAGSDCLANRVFISLVVVHVALGYRADIIFTRGVNTVVERVDVACLRADLIFQRFEIINIFLHALHFGVIAGGFFRREHHRHRVAARHAVAVGNQRHKRSRRVGADIGFVAHHKRLGGNGFGNGLFKRDLRFDGTVIDFENLINANADNQNRERRIHKRRSFLFGVIEFDDFLLSLGFFHSFTVSAIFSAWRKNSSFVQVSG